ncbi:mannitol dehydrogenase family protein [uncultured Microbacterium sp.]|uniref:mannitol dehydrogenase family protein n=1 Tax=uncultured Microbacterium sp. TaxID=191216 RepID=UPI0035CA053C
MAHLGLGAFHRAHQAWYTQHAGGEPWGIAAFTGRRPDAADALVAQGLRYTLITRSTDGDTGEGIDAIVAAHDGRSDAWARTIADPEVGVLTVTVTEAGYRPGATPPERIAHALRARADAGGPGLAIVSCDNLPGNGQALRRAVLAAAAPDLVEWIAANASFVDTMVDRITPATTEADRVVARALSGWDDRDPVVTEPHAEWYLAGGFPSGRPGWEGAGARFVDDVAPYEERKLWLLNAGHSLLAATGRLRGLETIDEAVADPELGALVEALWAEQRVVIDLPAHEIDTALDALRTRFANPRIRHRLDQISQGAALKLGVRILDPIARRREVGLGPGDAQLQTLLAWGQLVERSPGDAAEAALARRLAGAGDSSRLGIVIDTLTPHGETP